MPSTSPSPLPPIPLPAPQDPTGTSLFTALKNRTTTRQISPTPLSTQELSNLLWAAFGTNRAPSTQPLNIPGRTAPSASNSQEINLYVALPHGTYLYDGLNHLLKPIASGDLRASAQSEAQRVVAPSKAPVQLLYVVDEQRLIRTQGFPEPGLKDEEMRKSYYYVDTGSIAQNVYLWAAGQGMAAWFHNCEKGGWVEGLGLGGEERVLFAQSVGWPEGGR